MENEYYTPDIEEFHVGFEYEDNAAGLAGGRDYWCKSTIKSLVNLQGIPHMLESGCIRVKYLDKKDVESLGFEYDNNAEPIPSRQKFEDLPLDRYELPLAFMKDTQLKDGKLWIIYLYSDNTVWIEYIKNCAGYGYYFKGTIKNKSELKQVLKMLKIL